MTRFDAQTFLSGLVGRTITTLSGRPNVILRVTAESVTVATNRSPAGQPVPLKWVQSALDRLEQDRDVEISVESVGYRSAFIGAILKEVPGAQARHGHVVLPSPTSPPG